MSLDPRNHQNGEPCFAVRSSIMVVWLDETDLVEYGPRVAKAFLDADYPQESRFATARYKRGWWGSKDGPAP